MIYFKYRGWHLEEERMILPPNPFNINTDPVLVTLDGYYYKEGEYQNIYWMKYTGHKDDNDIEIYEGDIVYIMRGDRFYGRKRLTEKTSLIEQPVYKELENTEQIFEGNVLKLKVLGNYFQNPKLLDQVGS